MQTGYSGTPLAKKLGIKDGMNIKLVNPPSYYLDLFPDKLQNVELINKGNMRKDMIHYFAKNMADLVHDISAMKNELKPAGMIWISWSKKSSKTPANITENDIRKIALNNGLVDIKVCAIDETWSGLKLVIPVKDRK